MKAAIPAERYQMLPPLPPDQFAALKADIAKNGVLVPVEVDEFGNILDGHHRARACRELGINDYPVSLRSGLTESEKRQFARRANVLRRQLSRDQLRELVRDQLKDTTDWANNRIAAAIGVDDKTVATIRATMEATSEIPKLEKLVGSDGKARPNKSPKPARKGAKKDGDGWGGAFGGISLREQPDALPDTLKLALFEAGVSANGTFVIHGQQFSDPEEGLSAEDNHDWAALILYLIQKQGWLPGDAYHHFEKLRRNGWADVADWFGPVGDKYRADWGYGAIPQTVKEEWRAFAEDHPDLTLDNLPVLLEASR